MELGPAGGEQVVRVHDDVNEAVDDTCNRQTHTHVYVNVKNNIVAESRFHRR